jgi:heavy metal sensor kinase
MRVNSLRWRLQAWHAAILLLAISGFGAMLHASVRQLRFNEIDSELLAAAKVLEGGLRGLPRDLLEGRGLDRLRGDRRQPERIQPDRSSNDRIPRERPRGDRRPQGDRGPPPRGRPLQDPDYPQPDPDSQPDSRAREPEIGPLRPGPEPGRRQPPPPREQVERALRISNSLVERYADIDTPPYFIIWCRTGEMLKAQPTSAAAPRPIWNDALLAGIHEPQPRQHDGIREVYVVGPEATQIVVGRSIERELGALSRLTWQLVAGGAGVFAVGLVGGWWLSGRAVQPIRAMSATAASITAASLSRRIDTRRIDHELGELAAILNAMLDRIECAFEQQVRFTADASHELRTPLAIVQSHAELALARQRTPDEYRAALEAVLRSSRRMKLLVEELLTLARSDAGRLKLDSSAVDLQRVVEDSVTSLTPLAEEHDVRLAVRTAEALVTGDAHRLSQVTTNLLTNAIMYNRPAGEVAVSTGVDGSDAVLTVTDTGIGISRSDLPHLFERFYRVDRARGRERGGSGLGLAICQGIVSAHGGTITVASQLDAGTTVTVRIPKSTSGFPA